MEKRRFPRAPRRENSRENVGMDGMGASMDYPEFFLWNTDCLGGGISALNGAKCKLKACNGKIPSVFQEFWKKLGNVSSGLSAKKFKKKTGKWEVLGKMG